MKQQKQPSYLDYIIHFWREDQMEPFTPVQSRLYFLLLQISNTNHWAKEILVGDMIISSRLGVSLNTFRRARTALKERGLIIFEIGGKGHAHKSRVQLRMSTRVQSSSQSSIQNLTGLYNRNIDNKIKNKSFNKEFNTYQSDFD